MKSRLEPHFDIAPTNKSLGSPQSDGGSEGNSIERQWSPDSSTCLCCWVPSVGLLDSSLTQAAWAALIVDFSIYIYSLDDQQMTVLSLSWTVYINSTTVRGICRRWQVQGTTSALMNSSWTSLKSARRPASWRRTLPSACRCAGPIAKVIWNHSDG